jgi:G3E family GTPase
VKNADSILEEHRADIILAEAVGSCADLSATVYQPLRRFHSHRFDLAPLSVFADCQRVAAFFDGADHGFDESVEYLFAKQLAEADLIVLNKCDLVDPTDRMRLASAIENRVGIGPVHLMSARKAWGISSWVDRLLTTKRTGTRIAEMNYAVYAEAEASLGWLNATVDWTSPSAFSPRDLGTALVRNVQQKCLGSGARIAHLKLIVATHEGSGWLAVADCDSQPTWTDFGKTAEVQAASGIINARVSTDPSALESIVRGAITCSSRELGIQSSVQDLQAFAPAPPKPLYRFHGTEKDSAYEVGR